MSHERPGKDCCEVAFANGYLLAGPAEVALEDYARVLAAAERAEVLHTRDRAGSVGGVHLCGTAAVPTAEQRRDIEDFARDLTARAGESRLGWA